MYFQYSFEQSWQAEHSGRGWSQDRDVPPSTATPRQPMRGVRRVMAEAELDAESESWSSMEQQFFDEFRSVFFKGGLRFRSF